MYYNLLQKFFFILNLLSQHNRGIGCIATLVCQTPTILMFLWLRSLPIKHLPAIDMNRIDDKLLWCLRCFRPVIASRLWVVVWSRLFQCFSTPGPCNGGVRNCFTSVPMKIKHVTEKHLVVCWVSVCSIFLCTMRKRNALCYQYDNSKDCPLNNVSANSILR